jgi:nicotinate-nucleotide pyrophosphorylase (carboxylating)
MISSRRFVTMLYSAQFDQFVINALSEDIGDGDHSTLSCIDAVAIGRATLKIKQHTVIAGIQVAERIFKIVEPNCSISIHKNDGDIVKNGDVAFEVVASIHTILKCERLVLNSMQRMSGIATLTKQYTDKLKGYHSKLLDTRKTTPNFRLLEKEAVRIGGGYNHRFGLYDMIMLKDNHIDYCGSIEKAINMAYDYVTKIKPGLKIEVETRSLEDVETVLKIGKVDRIMLDNFQPEDIEAALKIIDGRYETEASGGITIESIERYAATGVDYISCGAIIHQAKSVDLSLKARIV